MQTIRARPAAGRSPQPANPRPPRIGLSAPADFEKHLRIHYPTLRTGESLFPEWDAHDFNAIEHRGHQRVTRELTALQNQLRDGRKFEKLVRYACANLFYLVLPNDLLREPEAPLRWGLLVEKEGALVLHRKPVWHDSSEAARLRILQKIAAAGTRQLNRKLELAPAVWERSPAAHRARRAARRRWTKFRIVLDSGERAAARVARFPLLGKT